MIYGKYKNARNAAWHCLIDYNIKSLPVNVTKIAKDTGIRVVKNGSVQLLMPNEIGASFINNNQWYIVYDDTALRRRSRYTIAHELGHIFLGHKLIYDRNSRSYDISESTAEQEADIFASRLLSPACVLWGLGLKNPHEIARACDISLTAAEYRAERMKILYERNRFLTNSLERKVYKNFEEYIHSQTYKN